MVQNARVKASNPTGVARPLKPYYSNCVRAGQRIAALHLRTDCHEKGAIAGAGDMRAQAEQVLKNIDTVVLSYGAAMSDVVNIIVYVTDISAFHSIADIRMRYFPTNGPARTIIEVSCLALPELMIEISAVVVVA